MANGLPELALTGVAAVLVDASCPGERARRVQWVVPLLVRVICLGGLAVSLLLPGCRTLAVGLLSAAVITGVLSGLLRSLLARGANGRCKPGREKAAAA